MPKPRNRRPIDRLLTTIIVAAAALGSSSAAADELRLPQIRALRERGEIVALDSIVQDARRRYAGGRLLEVELEQENDRYIYELEFLDHAGELRELYYDARTGELQAYEVYDSGDGTLNSILYDARTHAPMAVEMEILYEDGQRRRHEIDLQTGQPRRIEDD